MNNNTVGPAGTAGQTPEVARGMGWLDFYALLGVPQDADNATLRRKIGEVYSDATANIDHRDLSRRHYYQTLVEQVLPQARRILLDPTLRASYDRENARHARGESGALDYVSFMASLQGANADAARSALARSGEFDLLPERVRNEITLAQAVIDAVQSGSEFDLIPARALSSTSPSKSTPASISVPTFEEPPAEIKAPIQPEPAIEEPAVEEPAPPVARTISRPRAAPTTDEYFFSPGKESGSGDGGLSDTMPVEESARPRATSTSVASTSVQSAATSTSDASTPEDLEDEEAKAAQITAEIAARGRAKRKAQQGVTEVPDDQEPQIRAKVIDLAEQGKSVAQLRSEAQARAIADGGNISYGSRGEPEKKAYRPRVSVGDDAPRQAAPRRAFLSPVATHVATGLVSAGLMLTIWNYTAPPEAAPRAPLNVVYSSELRPILESAEAQFEASPEGAGTDVVLTAMDSRNAMNTILRAPDARVPDVWIPSETVWSNRYNQVAPKFKKRPINAGSGLALSPLVLVARTDQSIPLKERYPNRRIPSWNSLREAVVKNCANHFGMTDAERSGSGALVRTAMAREWSVGSKVPFGPGMMDDARLWTWLSSFENNVPGYKMAGDMVKDLALGTTGQYWWALAYESDAIYWMSQGKKLEVFYLPSTFYADHPFCRVEGARSSGASGAAAAGFEKFLRSPGVQQAILQGGFRAPEIDLTAKVANNPFQSKGYAQRGVKASGFNIGGRLDYRAVNALTAAWKGRFASTS